MPLIVSTLPASLSLPLGTSASYELTGVAYDFAIGGIPFLSAARESRPLERKTAPFRKQQVDQAANAGENSLTGWWYRSQLTFHGGAGQRYVDPDQNNPSVETRFWESAGVDVWTPGVVSLLPDAATSTYGAASAAVSYVQGTADCALYVGGADPVAVTSTAGVDTVYTGTYNVAQTTDPTTCCTNGSKLFVGGVEGIYSTPAVADITAGTWTKEWDGAASANIVINWVKQRLVAGIANKIYELAGGAPPTLPTAKYTHPNTSWKWTSISESSTAIYAAGFAGGQGAIYKFVLSSTDGSMPTLTSAIIAAQLPLGEVPYSIFGYLGIYLCIGTNKGIRVAVANDNGDLEYGPLIVELDEPVYQWAAQDRFVWCTTSAGIGGKSGTYRIDLGNAISNLRFAYATDFYSTASTGTVKACAFLGASNRLSFADQANIYYAHLTDLMAMGSLTTSRVRFSTLEPKLYKLVRIRGPVLEGALSVSTVDQNDSVASIATLSGSNPGEEDIQLSYPTGPQEFISLKFTFARGASDSTVGAQLYGYQLKALPGTPRKRLMVLPLLCFDAETDSHGVKSGYDGYALERLVALEAVEDGGDTTILQDLKRNTSYACTIEDIRFVETSPPGRNESAWGGILYCSIRTI